MNDERGATEDSSSNFALGRIYWLFLLRKDEITFIMNGKKPKRMMDRSNSRLPVFGT
jgi:hypothetical protein